MTPETTRDRILHAADELFGELGFDAATTREIAERSHVNKALIHYHFKSKESLLEALLDTYYRELTRSLRDALQAAGTLRDRMQALLDFYVDFLSQHRNFNRIVQREAAGGKHMERISAHMEPMFHLGVTVIEEAYPATRAGEMSAIQLLVSFYGMIITYFTFNKLIGDMTGDDPLSVENLAIRKAHLARMLDILIAAMERQETP